LESGITTKVKQISGQLIELDDLPDLDEFINEQITKCRNKFSSLSPDIDGAITNARSLLEAIMEFSLKKLGADIPKHDGDILKLYNYFLSSSSCQRI
jgi:hypothetical protein